MHIPTLEVLNSFPYFPACQYVTTCLPTSAVYHTVLCAISFSILVIIIVLVSSVVMERNSL